MRTRVKGPACGIMKALISWLRQDEGGRVSLPLGSGDPPYATIVRINQEPWPPARGWSLMVRKLSALEDEFTWIADVAFLAEEAPHHLLSIGCEFELFEGFKKVAAGKAK